MQKKIWISIIVIVILAIIGGAFLLMQKPKTSATDVQSSTTQTADWKTYTNTDYGFEMMLPQNWEQRNLTTSNGGILLGFCPISDQFCKQGFWIWNVSQKPEKMDDPFPTLIGFNEVNKMYYYFTLNGYPETTEQEAVMIGNITRTIKFTK